MLECRKLHQICVEKGQELLLSFEVNPSAFQIVNCRFQVNLVLKSRDCVVFRAKIEFLGRVLRTYFLHRKVVVGGDFRQYLSRPVWKFPLKCRFR